MKITHVPGTGRYTYINVDGHPRGVYETAPREAGGMVCLNFGWTYLGSFDEETGEYNNDFRHEALTMWVSPDDVQKVLGTLAVLELNPAAVIESQEV
jgi:hypothetical protein